MPIFDKQRKDNLRDGMSILFANRLSFFVMMADVKDR